jgi:hypothetical protein
MSIGWLAGEWNSRLWSHSAERPPAWTIGVSPRGAISIASFCKEKNAL